MAEPAPALDLFEGNYHATLEHELRAYIRAGGKVSRLSDITGLGAVTIRRLVYGETLKPRMHTVAALFEAFGYRVQIVRAQPSTVSKPALKAV
jgi:DNA-binding phage protein